MNFKDLLKIINEESREQADSFRTPGEAAAKEKAKNTPGDEKAKDAARKRAERAKQVPRSRKSKADLLKDIVVVKTKSGRVQLIFKDSFDKAKEMLFAIVSEEQRIVVEPEPFVGLGAIATKSIEVHLKVWVNTDDYNSVMYDLNESIYKSLTEAEFHFLVD